MGRASTRNKTPSRVARGKTVPAGGTAVVAGSPSRAGRSDNGSAQEKNRGERLAVCLLSQHELALAEFRAWLTGTDVELHPALIESPGAAELRRLDVPRVHAYVVDAHAPRAATEALVGGLLERFSEARVLVMAKHFTDANAFPLLRLGVKGLVEYGAGPQDLPRALLHVATGAYWVPRDLLSRFVDLILAGPSQNASPKGSSQLSRREQEVLDALLQNLSNKEIANNLNISERTAKFHVSNLLGKYGVQRRADLIVLHYQAQSPAPQRRAGIL